MGGEGGWEREMMGETFCVDSKQQWECSTHYLESITVTRPQSVSHQVFVVHALPNSLLDLILLEVHVHVPHSFPTSDPKKDTPKDCVQPEVWDVEKRDEHEKVSGEEDKHGVKQKGNIS